jgi:hypothetical protein
MTLQSNNKMDKHIINMPAIQKHKRTLLRPFTIILLQPTDAYAATSDQTYKQQFAAGLDYKPTDPLYAKCLVE